MTDTIDTVRIEPNPKWVRGYVNGDKVVDSRAVKLVWTHPYYPTWFFPESDVDPSLQGRDGVVASPYEELPGHVSIAWATLDHWFEEDVEVFVHPRSPYTRVDTLPSSRHVQVSIDGTVVADTNKPTILFETGLPARYYIPLTDVRMDLLSPTGTATACPYKGFASYWTATIDATEHADIAWSYQTPLPESETVAGMVCFYNEKVDMTVDGEPEPRPDTHFA